MVLDIPQPLDLSGLGVSVLLLSTTFRTGMGSRRHRLRTAKVPFEPIGISRGAKTRWCNADADAVQSKAMVQMQMQWEFANF